MKNFVALVFIFISLSVFANTNELVKHIVFQHSQVESAIKALNEQDNCNENNYYKINSELITRICNEQDLFSDKNNLSEFLVSKGVPDILKVQNIDYNQFLDNLFFFFVENKKVETTVNSSFNESWKFTEATKEDFDLWQKKIQNSKKNKFMKKMNIKTDLGTIPFVAANHILDLNPNSHEDAKSELISHLKQEKPDAIILEGYEIGHKLDCEKVLNNSIAPYEVLTNETNISIKYAFENKIVMIPGDSQSIDEVDYKLHSKLDKKELEEIKNNIEVLQFLHSYYSAMRNKVPNPLEEALDSLAKNKKIILTKDEVEERYEKLNGRSLPDNIEEIYKDFTPPEYLNEEEQRGTNLIVPMQDQFRNQALLTAIQVGQKNYGKVMPIYGSGHLPAISTSLNLRKKIPEE